VIKNIKTFFKECVYGAVDGTVTTFAIISAAVGSGQQSSLVVIFGLSNVLADGFSMAVSSYLANDTLSGRRTARAQSIATFWAFLLAGTLPTIPFLIDATFKLNTNITRLFAFSVALALASFSGIGYLRGKVGSRKPYATMIETVLLGSVASLIAYVLGDFLEKLLS
jgi:vacuolar iron transporter family protein